MKLTSSQLKQIIKEEVDAVLGEEDLEEGSEKRPKLLADPEDNKNAWDIYDACFAKTGKTTTDEEVCARTAKRQGPKGAQEQGRPYEDTLARPLK